MSSLRELQTRFRAALLAGDERRVAPDVVDDGVNASALQPAALARLTLRLDPSVTLLASRWPVDAMWDANQAGVDPAPTVDLDAGGVWLEIRRRDDDVVRRALPPAVFAFRAALAEGRALEDAVEGALDADPAFDLAGEIRALLDERLLAA